jgi:hypothetical protein
MDATYDMPISIDDKLGNAIAETTPSTTAVSQHGINVWNIDQNQLMLDSYYGDNGFSDGSYLVKFIMETDIDFLERRRIGNYDNFVKPIINSTYTPVFSNPVTRKTYKNQELDTTGEMYPLWTEFQKNADNSGNNLQTVIEQLIMYSKICGTCFAVVDNFKQDEITGNTLKDAAARKLPYVVIKLQTQVNDELLELDKNNNIISIGFCDEPFLNGKEKEPRWRVWNDMYSVIVKKVEGKYIYAEEPVLHNLGKVPVIVVKGSKDSRSLCCKSEFYNIARTNWYLYNLQSSGTRLLRTQCFSLFCASGIEGGVKLGPTTGFNMTPDSNGVVYPKPFYCSPDASQYTSIKDTLKDIRENIFKQADQVGVQGVELQSSGVAKAYDFQAQSYVLLNTSNTADSTESKIADIFKLYTGDDFTYTIIYCKSFTPMSTVDKQKSLTDYFTLIKDVTQLNPMAAIALKSLHKAVLGDDNQQVIYDWIDSITVAEVKEEGKEEESTEESTGSDTQ